MSNNDTIKDKNDDGFNSMIADALKHAGRSAVRHKCLELAVQLPELTGSQEAINAAKAFEAYITEEKNDA